MTASAEGLATGIMPLNMDCVTAEEGSKTCGLVHSDSMGFNTKGGQIPQEPGSSCPRGTETYQSWKVEQWKRQYMLPPGSSSSIPPRDDTGPDFVLRNMRSKAADAFKCMKPGNVEDDKFVGTCVAMDKTSASTADFVFDRRLSMLTVTQHWQCDGA
jgi:hypothetical protein